MGEHTSDEANTSELLDLALNDPVPALSRANDLLESEPENFERAVALRARGLARRQLGEFDESEKDLIAALDIAKTVGDENLMAGVGLTLAGTWVHLGRVDAAVELLETCVEQSDGEVHAEALYQLGTTHAQAGDLETALTIYDEVAPMILALERPAWTAHLLGNRGTMRLHSGDYSKALTDLDAAIAVCADANFLPSQTALYLNNKAYTLHLNGDIAASLDLYEESERFHEKHGLPTMMFAHKCSAHLAAGMYEETLTLAQRAYEFHTEGKAVVGAIEALLAGSNAALALGKSELAAELAGRARSIDHEGAFPVWAAHATLIELEARMQSGRTDLGDVAIGRDVATIAANSDSTVAARALLVAAAVAFEHGDLRLATGLLAEAAEPVDRAPLHVQIERNTLLARSHEGHDDRVLDAVTEGLRAFDALVRGVSAYDVRYKAGRHAEELGDRGLGVFLKTGRHEEAIRLLERLRTDAIVLDERTTGTQSVAVAPDETYLVWAEHEDTVWCLAQTDDALTVHSCGSVTDVQQAVDRHRFAHRQLARRARLTDASRTALLDAADDADEALASMVVPPMLSDRLILSPSGMLSSVLWAALPGLAERPFTVAPSLAIARRSLPQEISCVTVLGTTELAHVPAEVTAVASVWDEKAVLDPALDALASLSEVDLVHAAGHFEADGLNPLFSALPLGELRLRGAEYLQLTSPPRIAVLSACASGQAESVGGALVGFSSAALAAGTASVIVTQTIVEDGPTIANAMVDLHRALRSGLSPAIALRDIRTRGSRSDRSALAALSVLGAGW